MMSSVLVWTIMSVWWINLDEIMLTGEFKTQQQCLAVINKKPAGREIPPQVRQCVQLKQSDLHEYFSYGVKG